jgi:beta-glucanase (GH16 family)
MKHPTGTQVRPAIFKTDFPARAAACCVAIMVLIFAGETRAQNILSNTNFGTGNLDGWTEFGANNYIETGSAALTGNYYYKVYGAFVGATNFTGIYQEIPSAPGDTYSANGWAYSLSSDGGGIHGDDSIWIEVIFQNASGIALADYRSALVTGNNIAAFGGLNTWLDLKVTNQCSFTNASTAILSPGTVTNTVTKLVAPAGTAYVQYQVVFAQGSDNANGSMYFADLALNQISQTTPGSQWNIVWSDEFNGTSINTANWTYDLGNSGDNGELEYYTSSTDNAYVDGNGLLHIVALKQSIDGFSFTSARLKTQGLYNTPTYGLLQWRAALPEGVGMWPALWLLGSDYPSVGWPACGEIDVVENDGATPDFVQGSLHYGTDGEVSQTLVYDLPSGESTTNFHIYQLAWSPTTISFIVDGVVYESQVCMAPFNQPFFIIMNVAVGGTYVNSPSVSAIESGTTFPQEMLVDYVRVYEQTAPLQISAIKSNGNVVLSWPANIVCHLQTLTNLLTGNWSNVTSASNPYVVTPNSSQTSVFYRLESP